MRAIRYLEGVPRDSCWIQSWFKKMMSRVSCSKIYPEKIYIHPDVSCTGYAERFCSAENHVKGVGFGLTIHSTLCL